MAGTLFKKVLVPVDFSACSDEAFRVALQLADAVDADVTVMHVIDVNAVGAFNRLGLLAVPSGCHATAEAVAPSRSIKNETAPQVSL